MRRDGFNARLGMVVASAMASVMLAACHDDVAGSMDTDGSGSGATGGVSQGGSSSSGETDGHEPEGDFGDPRAMGPIGVRRLSTTELRDTLSMIIGADDTQLDELVALLPADSRAPFDNDYGSQTPSQPLIEGMLKLAETLADGIADDPAHRDALLGCTPEGPADEACLRQGIERLGRLVLRRPLAVEEIDAYATFITEAEEDDDFSVAVSLVLRAMLLDAEFLYRIEVGEPVGGDPELVRLTDYELASRLSFLLWGSGPDEALLDVAGGGGLQSPGDIYDTAVWMLEDPRATAQVQRMHAMWLGYDNLSIEPALAESLRTETDMLVRRALQDGDWLAMFTAQESWLDENLSEHYDIPLPGGEPGWVAYPDIRRGGILSHGSFLALGKKFSDTSPVERGKVVWTRLLCNDMPPPPPDVDTGLPPSAGGPDACKTERYDMQEHAECAGCHAILDPIGFGLENYGPEGQWRTQEPGKPQCSIEGAGNLSGQGDFYGPGALGERLVQTGQLQGCFMRHVYQFTVGRMPTQADDPMLDALTVTFEREDDVIATVLELVSSEAFRHRQIEEVQ